MKNTIDKIEGVIDEIKEQSPSRQRYAYAGIGFVLGILLTSISFWLF